MEGSPLPAQWAHHSSSWVCHSTSTLGRLHWTGAPPWLEQLCKVPRDLCAAALAAPFTCCGWATVVSLGHFWAFFPTRSPYLSTLSFIWSYACFCNSLITTALATQKTHHKKIWNILWRRAPKYSRIPMTTYFVNTLFLLYQLKTTITFLFFMFPCNPLQTWFQKVAFH